MLNCEDDLVDLKIGMTLVDAGRFLHEQFPQVPHWTHFQTSGNEIYEAMCRFPGPGYEMEGTAGPWRWKRLEIEYPKINFWTLRQRNRKNLSSGWVGAMQITGTQGESFIVFSYLNHQNKVCVQFMFSIADDQVIRKFLKSIVKHFCKRPKGYAQIHVIDGPDIKVKLNKEEHLFLPAEMKADIDSQVCAFFEQKKLFKSLGARYQRGFLFVGPPGTGKTMTIRNIIRTIHRKYKADFLGITIRQKTDEDDLQMLFTLAAHHAPAVIILEDLDSLTNGTQVTRSAFLSLLDGLSCNEGILIIGTSNNPELIDPALIHRPSRFDRIWRFPPPDSFLRGQFFAHHFKQIEPGLVSRLVRETHDWSYAYLSELRTTAAILAVQQQLDMVSGSVLLEAHGRLASQFKAGRKNHAEQKSESTLGFNAA